MLAGGLVAALKNSAWACDYRATLRPAVCALPYKGPQMAPPHASEAAARDGSRPTKHLSSVDQTRCKAAKRSGRPHPPFRPLLPQARTWEALQVPAAFVHDSMHAGEGGGRPARARWGHAWAPPPPPPPPLVPPADSDLIELGVCATTVPPHRTHGRTPLRLAACRPASRACRCGWRCCRRRRRGPCTATQPSQSSASHHGRL